MTLLSSQSLSLRSLACGIVACSATLIACSGSVDKPVAAVGAIPLIIGHRGASGYLPEHTLAAYSLAIWQGADFIEPDLVMTRDGVLIARHDNVLNLTTDVANHPEYQTRKTTKLVDGISATGWFSEDFTLEEIKTLRARERLPTLRPGNARFDDQFEIPTLAEIIQLAQSLETIVGHPVGLYPETKHPSYFAAQGLAIEELLVEILHLAGYDKHSPAFIQSFEIGNLKKLATLTNIPLVQLLDISGAPFDQQGLEAGTDYQQMATAEGLLKVAEYASGVGPYKPMVIKYLENEGRWGEPTDFLRDAKEAGLLVHPYTFRAENAFQAPTLKKGNNPTEYGDIEEELRIFFAAGVDGVFTDHPDRGVKARKSLGQSLRQPLETSLEMTE
ncbi:MAG: glycerophosphoryl diester phosphodiesterase [Halieaceae bacterium]|jgi:glycerophosphoryl diester phosphodiesterase